MGLKICRCNPQIFSMGLTTTFLKLLCIFQLIYVCYTAQQKRVLIYPISIGVYSAVNQFENVANVLADRGHDVYFLTSQALTRTILSPKVTRFTYQPPPPDPEAAQAYITTLLNGKRLTALKMKSAAELLFCRQLLLDKSIMKKLKEITFDLLIVDTKDLCSTVVIDYIDTTVVLYTSWGWDASPGVFFPVNPAYMSKFWSPHTDKMNFWQRLDNLYSYLLWVYSFLRILQQPFQELKQEFRLNVTTDVADAYYKAKLMIVPSSTILDTPKPLMPNVIAIEGFFNMPGKPLSPHYQNICDKSGSNGVILISFGSYAGGIDTAKEDFCEIFGRVLGKLKQQVIWKYPCTGNISSISENVHLFDWVPQNDILANEKTRLFITHAGYGSTNEAVYHGVPVIAIPFFFDQFFNANNAAYRNKMGVTIDFRTMTEEILESAIKEVLTNASYKDNARLTSQKMENPLVEPKMKLLYYLEHAMEPGGVDHLVPEGALSLAWYEYFMLDIFVFLTACVAVVIFVLVKMIKVMLRFIMVKNKQD